MTAVGREVYRRFSRDRLTQGDIGLSEFVQIRSGSGSERRGPGPAEVSAQDLPFIGEFVDHELPVARPGGGEEIRILRVWTAYVIVLSQTCELEWANAQDSRLTVAPIVSRQQWPEGPWEYLARTPPPGYFYLPGLTAEEASALGMPHEWPEAVALLASASPTSHRLIKPRRLLSLSVDRVPSLQDCIARFFGVRGFADLPALDALVGKPIRRLVETNQIVSGPSRLIKVYVGGDDADPSADDEATVAYWGVRP
jgi:hypothetical protein